MDEPTENTIENTAVNISTETFECESCGGIIKFSIAKQQFACASCGSEKNLPRISATVVENPFSRYLEREAKTVAFQGMATAVCQRCGMEISFDEKQIAAVCPMCASTQVATIKQRAGIPPDGIVPFKIDKHDAQQRFREWVKKRWFAPNDFKKRYGEGGLEGMYLPFWTYDADVQSYYRGRGGKQRIVRDSQGRTTVVTDWYTVSGAVSSSFDDVLICASGKQQNIRGILPYDTIHKTIPFTAGYFSGYYAELYTIKADAAFNDAKRIMDTAMRQLATEDILRQGFSRAIVESLQSEYRNITYKHVLLPVWKSAFGYKGDTYHYVINGETGKVSGNRPWSVPKIAAAVIAGLIILGALVWFLYTNEGGGDSAYYDRGRHYQYDYYNYREHNAGPSGDVLAYTVTDGPAERYRALKSSDGFADTSCAGNVKYMERKCA